MQKLAENIARQLADLGFVVSITLAYDWAFRPCDDAPADERYMLGLAEEAAWDGDHHPREIYATLDLPGGYVVDGGAYNASSIDDMSFLGIRPDGSDVELTLDQVVALAARYELAAA